MPDTLIETTPFTRFRHASLVQACATVSLVTLMVVSVSTWHNGGDRLDQPPKFGTHDYIAFKALDRAQVVDIGFIRNQLTAYFIGTEAPDTGKTVAGVLPAGYHDSGPCHCILFAEDGHPTRLRAAQRAREEFEKAVAALHAGLKQQ